MVVLFMRDDAVSSHEGAVDRANRWRAKRGLPPLSDKPPPGLTEEMIRANLERAARRRGLVAAAKAIEPGKAP